MNINLRVIASVFAVMLCVTSKAQAQDMNENCDFENHISRILFEFSIQRSFGPHLEFSICGTREGDSKYIYSRAFDNQMNTLEGSSQFIPLDSEKFIEIELALINALDFNPHDDILFEDGSSWCLKKSSGGTTILACFATPTIQTEERGLGGLVELGQKLVQFSEKSYDSLY